jgi:hypothetical protein
MLIHVHPVTGPSFDVPIDSRRDYNFLVNQISPKVGVSPFDLCLYSNQSCLGRTTVFDPTSGPPEVNVTVVSSLEFPRLSFPNGERLFDFDIGRFARTSVQNRYPLDFPAPPERPHPQVRELVRNIGFEFGDPYSMTRTITLEPRPDHAAEARLMFQELSGELAEAEAERKRRAKLRRQALTEGQRAAIQRMAMLGLEADVVAEVFVSCDFDQAKTVKRLMALRHHFR